MIYRCNECGEYFNEDEIQDIKPDGGSFHICGSDDYEMIYRKDDLKHCEKDIIDKLNELRRG